MAEFLSDCPDTTERTDEDLITIICKEEQEEKETYEIHITEPEHTNENLSNVDFSFPSTSTAFTSTIVTKEMLEGMIQNKDENMIPESDTDLITAIGSIMENSSQTQDLIPSQDEFLKKNIPEGDTELITAIASIMGNSSQTQDSIPSQENLLKKKAGHIVSTEKETRLPDIVIENYSEGKSKKLIMYRSQPVIAWGGSNTVWSDLEMDLIKFVKEHPIMYEDKRRAKAKKLQMKQDLFKQFAKSKGLPAEACYKRWLTIQSSYKRMHKECESRNITYSKFFDDRLSFLQKKFGPIPEGMKKLIYKSTDYIKDSINDSEDFIKDSINDSVDCIKDSIIKSEDCIKDPLEIKPEIENDTTEITVSDEDDEDDEIETFVVKEEPDDDDMDIIIEIEDNSDNHSDDDE